MLYFISLALKHYFNFSISKKVYNVIKIFSLLLVLIINGSDTK